MGYVIVGSVCMVIGSLIGIVTASLCYAAKDRDGLVNESNDICHGCFGASNNDCETCTRKDGERE